MLKALIVCDTAQRKPFDPETTRPHREVHLPKTMSLTMTFVARLNTFDRYDSDQTGPACFCTCWRNCWFRTWRWLFYGCFVAHLPRAFGCRSLERWQYEQFASRHEKWSSPLRQYRWAGFDTARERSYRLLSTWSCRWTTARFQSCWFCRIAPLCRSAINDVVGMCLSSLRLLVWWCKKWKKTGFWLRTSKFKMNHSLYSTVKC